MARFFVDMDTLKTIIKRIKRLLLKIHYLDELLRELDRSCEMHFENFKDIDIPKRLRVVIEEGLSVMMTSSSKKVSPFLHSPNEEKRPNELLYFTASDLEVELLRTLTNSYFLSV